MFQGIEALFCAPRQTSATALPVCAGIIGNEVVVRSPHMHAKMTFDSLRDPTAIIQIGAFSYVLITHPGVPAKTVKELIALAQARPGALTYGSSGVGSGFHLAGEPRHGCRDQYVRAIRGARARGLRKIRQADQGRGHQT